MCRRNRFAGLFYPKKSFVCADFDKCCQLCQYLAHYAALFEILVQSSELASTVSYGALWLILLARHVRYGAHTARLLYAAWCIGGVGSSLVEP